jgi:hypothetical protein
MISLDPEECVLLADSVSDAWQHLFEPGQEHDEQSTKAALAHVIVKAAHAGERSRSLLVAYGLAHFHTVKTNSSTERAA